MGILSDPTPGTLAIPRFDDGAIDMQELLSCLLELRGSLGARGSVEKVGVAPNLKRVGLASINLEYG